MTTEVVEVETPATMQAALAELTDPARARAEIVPLRTTDLRLQIAINRQIVGKWDAGEAAAEWGITKAAAMTIGTWAGSFLRIQRAPELLIETALSELRQIAEQARDAAELHVAVAAWKTILDQIGKLVDRAEKTAPAAVPLDAIFADPPPELRRLLLGWLTRVAGGEDAEVVAALEGAGWRRG